MLNSWSPRHRVKSSQFPPKKLGAVDAQLCCQIAPPIPAQELPSVQAQVLPQSSPPPTARPNEGTQRPSPSKQENSKGPFKASPRAPHKVSICLCADSRSAPPWATGSILLPHSPQVITPGHSSINLQHTDLCLSLFPRKPNLQHSASSTAVFFFH